MNPGAAVEDRAYGCIVVHGQGPARAVLLVRSARRGLWGFPKGHARSGESPHQAAERELEEETALRIRPPSDAPSFELTYRIGPVPKRVTLFLTFAEGRGRTAPGLPEIGEVRWASLQEARALLPHVDQRRLLDKVDRLCTGPVAHLAQP